MAKNISPRGALKWAFKVRNILKGWFRKWGLINTPLDVKELSIQRLEICERNEGICSKQSKLIEILNGKVEHVNTLVCTECHCPCLEKALVEEEKCPLNKWV